MQHAAVNSPVPDAIIGAHWFPASTAGCLGRANPGGYLAGAPRTK